MVGRPATRSLRPAARLSAACFAVASVFFLCGWGLASIAAADVLDFFYQPRPLAVTHTFTLGWISLMMIGVLYQYVPALTKRPLGLPALAPLQVGLFIAGVVGLVSHFWLGATDATIRSATMIAASVLLFAAEVGPPLLRAERWDATVLGIGIALLCFVATALLGFLFALDKTRSFLPGSVLTNIAGHAHLGLLGWITLTICAVSHRMVAARSSGAGSGAWVENRQSGQRPPGASRHVRSRRPGASANATKAACVGARHRTMSPYWAIIRSNASSA